jgi:hypothetical protein
MTSKIALSMTSWNNLHSFEWISDHHDSGADHSKSLMGSLFELMPSLHTLLITPILNPRFFDSSLSLPYLPLVQRLEVSPPLSLDLERLRGADYWFYLTVCHLPKLSHLSLFHGCNFEIDDVNIDHKWHSPLIQSLQFGANINRQDLETILSSSKLPLLHTLYVYFVDYTELETIARQCPTLQHLSIDGIGDNRNDDFGLTIGKMKQLKSLTIDIGATGLPMWMKSSSSQSWLQLKSLIHLQRLTLKDCELKSLESLPQLVELVQYLSNNAHKTTMSSSDDTNVSIVSNGSLEEMNDMPCLEWLVNYLR